MDGQTPDLVLRLCWYPALDGPGKEGFTDPHQLGHPLLAGGELVPQAVELVPVHPLPQVQWVDGGHLQKTAPLSDTVSVFTIKWLLYTSLILRQFIFSTFINEKLKRK